MAFTFAIAGIINLVLTGVLLGTIAFPELGKQGKLSDTEHIQYSGYIIKDTKDIAFAFFEIAFSSMVLMGSIMIAIKNHILDTWRIYLTLIFFAILADIWLNIHTYVFEGFDGLSNTIVIPFLKDILLNLINLVRIFYDAIEPTWSLFTYTARDIVTQFWYITISCDVAQLPVVVNKTQTVVIVSLTSISQWTSSIFLDDLDMYNVSAAVLQLSGESVPTAECLCKALSFSYDWTNQSIFYNTDLYWAIHYTVNSFIEIIRLPVRFLIELFIQLIESARKRSIGEPFICGNDLQCQLNRPPKFTKFSNYSSLAQEYTGLVVDDIVNQIYKSLFGGILNTDTLPRFSPIITHSVAAGIKGVNITLDIIFHFDLIIFDNYIKYIDLDAPYAELRASAQAIENFACGFNVKFLCQIGCMLNNLLQFWIEVAFYPVPYGKYYLSIMQAIISDAIGGNPIAILDFVADYNYTNLQEKANNTLNCFFELIENINVPLGEAVYFAIKYWLDSAIMINRLLFSFEKWITTGHLNFIGDANILYRDGIGLAIALGNVLRQFDSTCVNQNTGKLPDPFNDTIYIIVNTVIGDQTVETTLTDPQSSDKFAFFCCAGNGVERLVRTVFGVQFMFSQTIAALIQTDFFSLITGTNPIIDIQNKLIVHLDQMVVDFCCSFGSIVGDTVDIEGNGVCSDGSTNSLPIYTQLCSSAINFTILPIPIIRILGVFNVIVLMSFQNGTVEDKAFKITCYFLISSYDILFLPWVQMGDKAIAAVGCLFDLDIAINFASYIWDLLGWDSHCTSGTCLPFNIRDNLCRIISGIITAVNFIISIVNGQIGQVILGYVKETFNIIAEGIYDMCADILLQIENSVNAIGDVFCAVNTWFTGFQGNFNGCIGDITKCASQAGVSCTWDSCDALGTAVCPPSPPNPPNPFHVEFGIHAICPNLTVSKRSISQRSVDILDTQNATMAIVYLLMSRIFVNESSIPQQCVDLINERNSTNTSSLLTQKQYTDEIALCITSFKYSSYVNMLLAPTFLHIPSNFTQYSIAAGIASVDQGFIDSSSKQIDLLAQLARFTIIYSIFTWQSIADGHWIKSTPLNIISINWLNFVQDYCDDNSTLSEFLCPFDLPFVRLGVGVTMLLGPVITRIQSGFKNSNITLQVITSSGSATLSGFKRTIDERGFIFSNENATIGNYSVLRTFSSVFWEPKRPRLKSQLNEMYLRWTLYHQNITDEYYKWISDRSFSQNTLKNRYNIAAISDHLNARAIWNQQLHNNETIDPRMNFDTWRNENYHVDQIEIENRAGANGMQMVFQRNFHIGGEGEISETRFCDSAPIACINCAFLDRVVNDFVDNIFVAISDTKRVITVGGDFKYTPFDVTVGKVHLLMQNYTEKYTTEEHVQRRQIWTECSQQYRYFFDRSKITELHNITSLQNETLANSMNQTCYEALIYNNPNLRMISTQDSIGTEIPEITPINGPILITFFNFQFPQVDTKLIKKDVVNFFVSRNYSKLDDPNEIMHYINLIYNNNNKFPTLRRCDNGLGLATGFVLAAIVIIGLYILVKLVPSTRYIGLWLFENLMVSSFAFVLLWLTLAYGNNPIYYMPPFIVFPKCLMDDIFVNVRSVVPDCVPWNAGIPGLVSSKCSPPGHPYVFPDMSRSPYFFDSGVRNTMFLLHWKAPTAANWIRSQPIIQNTLDFFSGVLTTDLRFPFPEGERPPDAWVSGHNITIPNYYLMLIGFYLGTFIISLLLIYALIQLRSILAVILGFVVLGIDVVSMGSV